MLLSDSPQSSLASTSLLEKIDKLFECGVGDLIDLPRIVVVGDQSSGKSSVLEGLVRRPFPRDSGLCTRFATQFVFRRAEVEHISASIIPHANATHEERAHQEMWCYPDLGSLESETFRDVMEEVHDVLGLARLGEADGKKPTFSDSVLRLEISGPSQEHLSVIDVPGIFKRTTAGVTTKADIEQVRCMVSGYMDNPRTVMLAVVPANVDVATQEILEMANDMDPEGDRTLGVLTKPDLVDKGAERHVLDMIRGDKVKMQLGWHVVRNPGQRELENPSTDRDLAELEFFRNNFPWSTLDASKTGVDALRLKLNEILSDLVKREFPKVGTEISKKLASNEKLLDTLGPERTTTALQAAYLTELSVKFQSLMSGAIDGKFPHDTAFDQVPELRLATAVIARMETFNDTVALHGHRYIFRKMTPTIEDNDSDSKGAGAANPESKSSEKERFLYHRSTERIITRETGNPQELRDILQPTKPMGLETGDILSWLKGMYQKRRGFELGTFQPSILVSIMKEQSSNWPSIGLGFVNDVIVLVHKCILAALEHLVPEKSLRSNILSALLDGLVKRYKGAIAQTTYLLSVERDGIPLTLNHYFNDNLQKIRRKTFMDSLKASAVKSANGHEFVTLENAIKTHPMSNADHTVEDIHNILLSYYKVAKKRFTDNVAAQAVVYHLLTGPDTPLSLFSPSLVGRLPPEELQNIVGEAPSVKKRRAQLQKEIASLTEAKSIVSRAWI